MAFFETIAVAFAMYSAIPVPQPEWNQRNMRYALCAFPLVGVACGLLWWGWSVVCGVLGFPDLLRGAGFCLLPVICGHQRRTVQPCPQGEKAGDSEGLPLRCICSNQVVWIFHGVLGPLLYSAA